MCKVTETRDWTSQVARSLQAARSCTRAKHAEKLKCHANWSTIGKKFQTGHLVSSRLELTARSSRKAKPPANSILEKLTLRIPNTHKYKYPSYPRNIESFQREYWEKNPREKQDWLIHNLHIETFQFLYSHSLHCYIIERFVTKTFLTIPTSVRRPFDAW